MIATLPYEQDWSNGGLITANDDWSGVTGVQGFLGQDISTTPGADPQTLTGESALPDDSDVVADALVTQGNGGVLEISGDTIAVQGSGTADAPYVAFHLDLTGESGAQVSYDARDLDASLDNAAQQIAVQYRVGNTGAYTNLVDGYIADATTGPSLATLVTHRDVNLPAEVDGEADVYVRFMTTNAGGNDELVGIDNIAITMDAEPTPVVVTDPGDKTGQVGQPITEFDLVATGGTPPYTWEATGLPAGIDVAEDGTVSGTPTGEGVANVTVTASDSATPTAVTDDETFTFTISAAASLKTIAEIQGTTGTSPLAGQATITRGVVTALYPNGGFNGFYIQTPGADTTPGASDAIFVFGPTFDETTLAIGDSVEVAGTVSEFTTSGTNTLTEITASSVTDIASLGAAVANTVIPGSDCALPGTACPTLAAADTAKEEVEGEIFQPTGTFTVTDSYDGSATNPSGSGSSSFFGEVGLAANSALPLISPTELVDASDTAGLDARNAYNNGHRVVLDDGSSTTFWNTANTASGQDDPLPWFTPTHTVRVGATVTFPAPVVLENRFGWKIQPTTTVVGAPVAGAQPQFAQDRPAAPAAVGGDLKLATFNVLNYFTTLGADYDAGPGTCSAFVDRDGNPIAVNSCDGSGPRGAWNTASFERQQAKIVNAINTMDADIVSLEEIENSRKVDGVDRDEAVSALVDALNDDAGSTRWAFAASPAEADLPPVGDEDVIRTAFIYNPDTVELVGDSAILTGSAPFENAREPMAQGFKATGTDDADGFAVVVNHFKSKGCTGASGDNVTGAQGCFNGDRTRQAQALDAFADGYATDIGVAAVFLTGDFNSYSKEDPVQELESAGWVKQTSTDDPNEESYSFDGASGSLDHVFANAAADTWVDGVDIWEINANETVFNQYSRFNYVGTNLYDDGPFSASDHNPEIVGIDVPGVGTDRVQILATNDFHGRIANDSLSAAAGAGVMAGAVKQLRAKNPNTVFAAAGDLIGASTFESFILNDKPTIDALNEAGLDVSSVGNHEFDQGYDDLVNRVMDPTDPEGGAEWEYLAANVRLHSDDSRPLAPSWTADFGGITVGFVGAVTEHLPELVSPGGIEEIYVTDVVEEVNEAADDLVDNQDADLVVMLVHEGAPMTDCTQIGALATNTDFGSIVKGVNDNIDAIVSGHTHLEYNCSFPVTGWSGRDVTERPVVSAGQYGAALNRLIFDVDVATGDVVAKRQSVLKLKAANGGPFNYPVDAPTQAIVDAALAEAAVLGAEPLGQIAGPIKRGYLSNGTTENRGVESSLGNLVAEAQRWQTSGPEAGSAQIAFMNPGGLRTDMVGVGTGAFPRVVNFKQAAEVQPFANGLVNMDLTGAQIKAALEQQWQPAGASRPFLKLGASKGFTYTSDPDAAQGSRITGMWLDGVPIVPATVYSVTVNSFLSTGGDNFGAFALGVNKAEAGLTDLQAMVNYFDEFANVGEGDAPLPVPTEQNGVHVNFPPAAPSAYAPGGQVTFDVSGWSFSNADDIKDTDVVVTLGATTLGTFPLDNTIQAALPGFDETGKASVDVTLPAATPSGTATLLLTGATTGTEMPVVVTVDEVAPATPVITVSAPTMTYGKSAAVKVTVSATGETPSGTVQVKRGSQVLGTGTVTGGQATITLPAKSLAPGVVALTAVYSGDSNVAAGSKAFNLSVFKAASVVAVKVKPATVKAGKTKAKVIVTVKADGVVPVNGKVKITVQGQGTKTITLKNGRAVWKLAVFKGAGKRKVTVKFLSTNLVKGDSAKDVINVKP